MVENERGMWVVTAELLNATGETERKTLEPGLFLRADADEAVSHINWPVKNRDPNFRFAE
jgi:hypothetical protein